MACRKTLHADFSLKNTHYTGKGGLVLPWGAPGKAKPVIEGVLSHNPVAHVYIHTSETGYYSCIL